MMMRPVMFVMRPGWVGVVVMPMRDFMGMIGMNGAVSAAHTTLDPGSLHQ